MLEDCRNRTPPDKPLIRTSATSCVCGLVVEERIHHQITGEPMKFLSVAVCTGIIETELFAKTYKSHGLATVRYPALKLKLAWNQLSGRGFALRALAARRPRLVPLP
ncbi:MAG: polymerase [Verrucomicrobiales bacterium]|nr:polymerase [Verrucomicrobiales bacterium]